MAGVSTKELKNRIRSLGSTRQITKAMEMVAASKLRSAQDKAIASRPYFEALHGVMSTLADSRSDSVCPYAVFNPGGRICYVVIAGDRGLAGGYNSGVLKAVWSQMEGKDCCVLPMGKKAVEFFRNRNIPMLTEQYAHVSGISVSDCFTISRILSRDFLKGKYSHIHLGYTNFVSLLAQTPCCMQLLPLPQPQTDISQSRPIIYEPDSDSVYHAIVPEYLGGLIYGAVCESVASEQAARRTAMDAATKNADEMIDGLSLQYNRARQSAITQEITEIVAGA